ncbi:MAG: DUF2064 domain-containing protein [Gemmatimonadaceae bacterium]
MEATNVEHDGNGYEVRERSMRRVIENVELSDHRAGERVIEAVRNRLADGSHRVIFMSADSALPDTMLDHAFDALRFSRLVCAPGSGGEIVLLGMSQSHDAIVASIPWGTGDALEALLRAARESHLPLVLLPPVSSARAA